MKTFILGIVLLLSSMGISIHTFSHHSMIRFDTGKSISVEGVVKKLEWQNPHVYIYIQQITESGEFIDWEIEGPPPALVRRLGWSRNMLAPGQVISVTGNPHRDTNVKSIYPSAIASVGKSLYNMTTFFQLANSYEEPFEGANSLEGHWFTILDIQQMIKFVVPTNLDLTNAGKLSVDQFDEATMLPARNCIASPAPLSMLFPDMKKIEISDDRIILRGEYEDTVRTIYLQPIATKIEPSIQGYSLGTWEDGTLVVNTNNFSEHRAGNGAGLASSASKSIREWFSLSDDGKSLNYRFEVLDPQYLNSPAVGELTWIYQPDGIYKPEACDVENAKNYIH